MKILYLVSYFHPIIGAAAINTAKIVEYLINYDHQVLVLTPGIMGKNYRLIDTERIISSPNFDLKCSSNYIKYPFNLILSPFENMINFILKLKKFFTPDIILS